MPIDLFILGTILAGISSAFFGIIVYANNRGTTYGLTFFLVSISVSLWALSYSIWLSQPDEGGALFWSRVLNLGATFVPIFFFHWIVSFLRIPGNIKYVVWSGYILASIFAFFSFSPFYITSVAEVGNFPFWPQAGPLYTAFLILGFVGFFGYSILLLLTRIIKDKKGSPVREQSFYILVGAFISIIGGSSNFPLMYGVPFFAELTLLTIFHPFFWAYAAFKHKAFNLKIIGTEIFIFGIWVFLLARTIFAEKVFDQIVEGTLLFLTVVLGIYLIRSVNKEVTTRKMVENLAVDLRNANERLRELDQQKSEFVSIASHQLRSPLTAMKGYASMLLEGSFGELSTKVKNPIEKIFISSRQLVNIVEDFLNITRIEQGRMKYAFQPVDIKKLTEEVVGELEPNAIQINTTIELNTDDSQEYLIRADEGKIRQVVINLIDNAIKYSPGGTVRIFFSKNKEKNTVEMRVSDTGIGIVPEFMNKLFKKFSRAENSSKLHASGSGIGLYLVHEIVKAHNGRVWAESDGEGKGATFSVGLPASLDKS